jgi:hypothetical protein
MDAVSALANDALYFGEPAFQRIVSLQRASRAKTRADNGKNDAIKERLKLRIECAVYKNIAR